MKFKINKNNTLYEVLLDLHERGRDCENAAKDWIKKRFGKERKFASPDSVLFGGIAAVQLPQALKGWKCLSAKYKLYEPKTPLAKKQIKALPVVEKQELKDLLQYANYPTPSGINTVPSVYMGEDYALVSVPDMVRGYEPLSEMGEILGSEYNRLYDLAEIWRKNN